MSAFVLLPILAEAQLVARAPKESYGKGIWPFRINRFDSSGQFHGMWEIKGQMIRQTSGKGVSGTAEKLAPGATFTTRAAIYIWWRSANVSWTIYW